LIPGGFGVRGSEGKIRAIKYARENNIPFLGVCFGMQLAVVEFARNVVALPDANSTELNEHCSSPVIDLLPDQHGVDMGGTMRLGIHTVNIVEGSRAFQIYNSKDIRERHRHRYEVNPAYREMIQSKGMIFSGWSPDYRRVEIIELQNHPFFIASQFHPEFLSRPENPSPLHKAFLKAAHAYRESRK
ncbi:MAG: gamma-glutamyl-gamma-aminobutyrate hydrolase family protein, partial [Thermoplasmata archaeon]